MTDPMEPSADTPKILSSLVQSSLLHTESIEANTETIRQLIDAAQGDTGINELTDRLAAIEQTLQALPDNLKSILRTLVKEAIDHALAGAC